MDEGIMMVRLDAMFNGEKYANGLDVHTVDESVTPAQKRSAKEIRDDEARNVCLNCRREFCDGSNACFNRERNRRR